jgi:ABC-2 type transport system ATP-binding protein
VVAAQHIAAVRALSFVEDVCQTDNSLAIKLDDPETNNPHLVRALVSAGADVQFIEEMEHSLEAVYFDLMAQTREESSPVTVSEA